jgi:hypothetical protein
VKPQPLSSVRSLGALLGEVGRLSFAFERQYGLGAARVVAGHPDTLARLRAWGESIYEGNSKSFVQVLGLTLEDDPNVPSDELHVRA